MATPTISTFSALATQTAPFNIYCRGCQSGALPCLPPPTLSDIPNPTPNTPSGLSVGGTLFTIFSGGVPPPPATIPGGSWRYNQTSHRCFEYNGQHDLHCSLGDVHALCSRVDPSVCFVPSGSPFTDPSTGNKTVNAYFNPSQPDTLVNSTATSVTVGCDYNAAWFTAADITEFQQRFCPPPENGQVPACPNPDPNFANNENILLYNFCSQQVPPAAATDPTNPSCPINIVFGGQMTACSYFVAQGAYQAQGNICRTWELKYPIGTPQPTPVGPDAAKTKYCTDSTLPVPNAPDCACINRQQNQIFQALTGGPGGGGGSTAEPGCWYAPCSSATSAFYLTLTNGQDGPPLSGANCPTICEQVVNIYGNNAGTINVNDRSVISGCGTVPPNTSPPAPPSILSPLIVILVIGAIILIIIIVVVVIWISRRSRSRTIGEEETT